jgi:DNA-binding transcriptional regulator YiaG
MKKKTLPAPGAKVVVPQVLTGKQLAESIGKLGLSQEAFGRFIGVGGRAVRGWIAETSPMPGAVAYLVKLMVKTKTTAEDLL